MNNNLCCAVIGQSPMRFPWGFDEEDVGCNALKLALAQRIMELRQQGVLTMTLRCFTQRWR